MDPQPAILIIALQDANKKLISKKVFLHITFRRYLHQFSIIKSQKEVAKLFLLKDRRIRIQEGQKHVDPVDPDPYL
jgi:hypothetical protein